MLAEKNATRTVTHAASSMASFCISSPYHLVEKPPQTVTSFDFIERIDDQQQDRHVQKDEAEGQRGGVEP